MTLLFLESVGTTELLLILVVALIAFGPRKLPELSRSLGKGLSEFRRASDEFKRTWEREVNLESYERERRVADAMLPPEEHAAQSISGNMVAPAIAATAPADAGPVARGALEGPAATAQAGAASDYVASNDAAPSSGSRVDAAEVAPQSPHKADWL